MQTTTFDDCAELSQWNSVPAILFAAGRAVSRGVVEGIYSDEKMISALRAGIANGELDHLTLGTEKTGVWPHVP